MLYKNEMSRGVNKASFRIFLFFLQGAFFLTPLFAGKTRAEMQDMYLSFFNERGIEAYVDDDGDIAFRHNFLDIDLIYWIGIDENDLEFFQIFTTNLWGVESEEELQYMRRAANHANSKVWFSKIVFTMDKDDILISTAALLTKPEDFSYILDTMLLYLDEGIRVFLNEMRVL